MSISVFNNTIGAWRAGKPSKDSVRITGGRKVDDTFKGISIYVPSEGLNTEALGITESDDIVTVYEGNTGVYYENLTNVANACTTGSNKNFYLIALDIRGCRITNITKQDVFIFRYLIVKGILYLILSVKDTCKSFDVSLYNKEKGKTITHTFNLETKKVIKNETDGGDSDNNFKIRVFRPSRPTYLVYVKEEDIDLIDTKFTESHNVVKYTDDDDLSAKVNEACKAGYTAATLFTTLEEVLNNDFDSYDNDVCYLRSAFNQVNIILGGVVPNAIIKR